MGVKEAHVENHWTSCCGRGRDRGGGGTDNRWSVRRGRCNCWHLSWVWNLADSKELGWDGGCFIFHSMSICCWSAWSQPRLHSQMWRKSSLMFIFHIKRPLIIQIMSLTIIHFALIMFSNVMGLRALSECHTGHFPENGCDKGCAVLGICPLCCSRRNWLLALLLDPSKQDSSKKGHFTSMATISVGHPAPLCKDWTLSGLLFVGHPDTLMHTEMHAG